MPNATLVLGVGQRFRQDDGIGPIMIEQCLLKPQASVDYYDGGTDGLSLLDKMRLYEKVIIVDAVDMGATPGTIRVFEPSEAKQIVLNEALSTHGIGLAEVLELAKALEIKANIKIIGIQPASIDFEETLTPKVAAQIPRILELIEEEIGKK